MNIFFTNDRRRWREWLLAHFETEGEIHFVFPTKKSDEPGISYNDAVEEALCFGWIDSIYKNLDDRNRTLRFSPRRKGAAYSRPNIERLIWLDGQGKIHPKIRDEVIELIRTPYEFPADIIEEIKNDSLVWENYTAFPEGYKRIRIAYIDAARKRPEEFNKRLDSFIKKTRENRLIKGYGGIEKYYI